MNPRARDDWEAWRYFREIDVFLFYKLLCWLQSPGRERQSFICVCVCGQRSFILQLGIHLLNNFYVSRFGFSTKCKIKNTHTLLAFRRNTSMLTTLMNAVREVYITLWDCGELNNTL